MRQKLLEADCIHVSLDSTSPKTFKKLKGTDCFKSIKDGINSLCFDIRRSKKPTQVGIGFVVTQGNTHEVTEALDLASEIGAHFIRFKPDIRGTHAIPWRNWKKAEARIRIKQKESDKKQLNVIITEAGWSHYRVPSADRCWSQFFYTTVGSDGNLYPCDHLTANGRENVIGELGTFQNVWEAAITDGRVGLRQRQCILCPPFGWRLNRLVAQLYVLYRSNEWVSVKELVDKALKCV